MEPAEPTQTKSCISHPPNITKSATQLIVQPNISQTTTLSTKKTIKFDKLSTLQQVDNQHKKQSPQPDYYSPLIRKCFNKYIDKLNCQLENPKHQGFNTHFTGGWREFLG